MINLETKKAFKIALASTIIFILLFFILGLFIWNGVEPAIEKDGFCEAKRTGLLKEPMNSLSSLSYVLVGLYILYMMDDFPMKGKNPMRSRNIAPILYATGSIYIGLGSFAMHGSNTALGGILDWSGMLFFISFPVFYNLSRSYSWIENNFLSIFSIIFIITILIDGVGTLTDMVLIEDYSGKDALIATDTDSKNLKLKHITRDYFWALYIGTWIILESKNIANNNLIIMISLPLIALFSLTVDPPHMLLLVLTILFLIIAFTLYYNPGQKIVRRASPFLIGGITTYIIGNIVWRIDKSVEHCVPESLFQYHSLWHMSTAFSVLFFYYYFSTEEDNLEINESSE
ncbi:MAG: hypothetical protein CMB48_06375 [Euryarchaeota archaeon]|nr:hypothetical protein [Euryarchaeota archaeon]|tara:strand:- start:9513 stop:10544 length:1032 start_codon:yes stop_codon:yes gene_type:complete